MEALAVPPNTVRRPSQGQHLWGPWADVTLLGGASLIAFLVIRAIDFSHESMAALFLVTMVCAHVVNHPHFAHSYQIFYGSRREVVSGQWGPGLAWRWWWVGFAAPVVLLIWLVFAGVRAFAGDTWWIAVSINLMGALVGWHYVKQGFGMAMTDAALKRSFWPAHVRQALLLNAYACWAAAWVGLNSTKAATSFWGFFSLEVQIPVVVVVTVWVVGLMTTCWTTLQVARALGGFRAQNPEGQLPYAGLLAYVVTLYLWTVFAWVDPAYMLVIPFFHSLQYLTVVWRYKLNELAADAKPSHVRKKVLMFALRGVVLGALGFWLVPGMFDFARTGTLSLSVTQTSVALASAWLFINVHHYLIDNVLWRKGNPSVAKHLFGQSKQFQSAT